MLNVPQGLGVKQARGEAWDTSKLVRLCPEGALQVSQLWGGRVGIHAVTTTSNRDLNESGLRLDTQAGGPKHGC